MTSNAIKRIRVEEKEYEETPILSMNTVLTDVIYENISGEYGKVEYLGFFLIINRKTGFINATHLCQQSEKKRDYFHWSRLNNAKETITDLAEKLKCNPEQLTRVISGGQIVEIRGTYVHPMLVPVIAQWASPKFRTRVAIILEEMAVREYKAKIRQKDDKIDELKKMMEEQHRIQQAKIDELLGYSQYSKDKLDDIQISINNISENTVVVESKVDDIRETVTEHVVAPAPNTLGKQHGYVVFRIDENTYKTIRRQFSGLKNACAKILRENPGARVVFEAKPCANAVSLHTRVVEALRDNPNVQIHYQRIELTRPDVYDENNLLSTLHEVYDKCNEHVEKIETIKTKLDVINKTIVQARA